jgi:hypothetical protein
MLKRHKDETDEQYEARREAVRRIRAPIDFKYFCNQVVRGEKGYEAKYGQIPGMIREAFGLFVEPHSEDSVQLGTLEVADYDFPEHTFDKILVVEKRTERPKFQHDRVAERHDLGIVYSGGYATEALHELLDAAEDQDYQIFVWHDADPDGYNIVRNIREITQNMPLSIEVIDLGLPVEQALDLGLAGEPLAEDRTLGYELVSTLNDVEREYFLDRRIRFEINSIPTENRIAYVEQLLEENGARPKYVPTRDVLEEEIEEDFEREITVRVNLVIDEMVDKDAIVTDVMDAFRDDIQLDIEEAEKHIRERFEQEPETTWRSVVDMTHRRQARSKLEEIKEMVAEQIVTRVTDDSEDDDEGEG